MFESITMQIFLPQNSLSRWKHRLDEILWMSLDKGGFGMKKDNIEAKIISEYEFDNDTQQWHQQRVGKWILIEMKLLATCTDDFFFVFALSTAVISWSTRSTIGKAAIDLFTVFFCRRRKPIAIFSVSPTSGINQSTRKMCSLKSVSS